MGLQGDTFSSPLWGVEIVAVFLLWNSVGSLLWLANAAKWRSFIALVQSFSSSPPGLGGRRMWLALTALACIPTLKVYFSHYFNPKAAEDEEAEEVEAAPRDEFFVTEEDFERFRDQIETGKEPDQNGWERFVANGTEEMDYVAWRRDPDGWATTQYLSKTILEDTEPEHIHDFYYDDDFRPEWDGVIHKTKVVDRAPQGDVVYWLRKFPVGCGARDYVLARRTFRVGDAYYCVTKSVNHHAAPENGVTRVHDFNSCWRLRSVEGKDGRKSACEIILLHHEDQKIPRGIAKMAVKLCMWGFVKAMAPGVRKFQALYFQGEGARTGICTGPGRREGVESAAEGVVEEALPSAPKKADPKWLLLGLLPLAACSPVAAGAAGGLAGVRKVLRSRKARKSRGSLAV